MREIPCSLRPNTCHYCQRCHSQRKCPDHILTLTYVDSALPKKNISETLKIEQLSLHACMMEGFLNALTFLTALFESVWICLIDLLWSSPSLTSWPATSPPLAVCSSGWIWPLAFVTMLPTCGRPLTCALPFSLGRTGELDDILPEFDMEIMPGMAAFFLSSSPAAFSPLALPARSACASPPLAFSSLSFFDLFSPGLHSVVSH